MKPLAVPLVAAIVTVPAATPVTRPLELTVAADILLLDHVTVAPGRLFPNASLTVGDSASVDPVVTLVDGAEIVTDAGVPEGDVAAPVMPEYRSRLGVPAGTLLNTFGVAPPTIADATCVGVAVGFADKYRAATPATCGDAIDVPPIYMVAVSLPI